MLFAGWESNSQVESLYACTACRHASTHNVNIVVESGGIEFQPHMPSCCNWLLANYDDVIKIKSTTQYIHKNTHNCKHLMRSLQRRVSAKKHPTIRYGHPDQFRKCSSCSVSVYLGTSPDAMRSISSGWSQSMALAVVQSVDCSARKHSIHRRTIGTYTAWHIGTECIHLMASLALGS